LAGSATAAQGPDIRLVVKSGDCRPLVAKKRARWSRRPPGVSVMQDADSGKCDDLAEAGRFDDARDWCFAVERHVRPADPRCSSRSRRERYRPAEPGDRTASSRALRSRASSAAGYRQHVDGDVVKPATGHERSAAAGVGSRFAEHAGIAAHARTIRRALRGHALEELGIAAGASGAQVLSVCHAGANAVDVSAAIGRASVVAKNPCGMVTPPS